MSWTKARSELALLSRDHPNDHEALANARRALKAERLADHIKRTVESAPELTPEQVDRLALLLRSSSSSGGVAA